MNAFNLAGYARMIPVKNLFVGQQVLDKYDQVKVVLDSEEKWRGPGILSYHGDRFFGILCKFAKDETQTFERKGELRELVIESERGTFPVEYTQWGPVRAYPQFLNTSKLFHFNIEPQITGFINMPEIAVAHVTNLIESYHEYDMEVFAKQAFEAAQCELWRTPNQWWEEFGEALLRNYKIQ